MSLVLANLCGFQVMFSGRVFLSLSSRVLHYFLCDVDVLLSVCCGFIVLGALDISQAGFVFILLEMQVMQVWYARNADYERIIIESVIQCNYTVICTVSHEL